MRGSILAVVMVALMVPVGMWFWDTWQASQPPESAVTTGSVPPPTTEEAATEEAGTTVAEPAEPPACAVGDEPAEGDPAADWATIVVDTERRLPADFEPPDLVDTAEAGFEGNGEQVREIIVGDLAALREAAEANGTPLIIVSAYRTPAQQQILFDDGVERHGPEDVVSRIARPGHSEHQLGTAIDVLNPEATSLDVTFASTPAGQWLAEHAHEFGFVFSYPEGAVAQACYEYEPWHLRYVGPEMAAQIRDSEMAPRAWLLTGQATEQDAANQAPEDANGVEAPVGEPVDNESQAGADGELAE